MYNDQNRKNSYPGGRQTPPAAEKKPPLNKLTYVRQAEKVISEELIRDKRDNSKFQLTSNQIRNILTMTNELYNSVRFSNDENISEDLRSHIQYTKMKIAYSAGRDRAVKDFVEKSCLIQYLDEVGDSRDMLITFCHYAEALVAYHKFYGGDDK